MTYDACDTIWYVTVRYGTIWYDTIRYDMIWYDTTICIMVSDKIYNITSHVPCQPSHYRNQYSVIVNFCHILKRVIKCNWSCNWQTSKSVLDGHWWCQSTSSTTHLGMHIEVTFHSLQLYFQFRAQLKQNHRRVWLSRYISDWHDMLIQNRMSGLIYKS